MKDFRARVKEFNSVLKIRARAFSLELGFGYVIEKEILSLEVVGDLIWQLSFVNLAMCFSLELGIGYILEK